MMSVKFCNLLMLGFGFMFIFTTFLTVCNTQKIMIDSISKEVPTFTADGYISLAIIYTLFAFSNWLAPSFIACTGPRIAMLLGALPYTAFTFTFLFPSNLLFYCTSAVLGIGAALLWTGQGNFFARCSDESTISRNSGIFWTMLQSSMFFGNLWVYNKFENKEHIDSETRFLVIIALIALSVVGLIFLALLRSLPDKLDPDEIAAKSCCAGAYDALLEAGRLFITPNMLLLNELFFYSGVELAFYSGVYGASIGFTKKIHTSAKEIVGLAGIYIGGGEVFGGALFGIFGEKFVRFGRTPIVMLGYVAHMIAFFLIFLNLPDNSPFRDTDDISYFDPPHPKMVLSCAFLLGFGDACMNTQIYAVLARMYELKSSAAFAIFKFVQSFAAAIAFFYSSHLGLRLQLIILAVLGTLATGSFYKMELKTMKTMT